MAEAVIDTCRADTVDAVFLDISLEACESWTITSEEKTEGESLLIRVEWMDEKLTVMQQRMDKAMKELEIETE